MGWIKQLKKTAEFFKNKSKVYVICRDDLDTVYASVQGGHALADLILSGKLKNWNNEYLIYLQCDLAQMFEIRARLDKKLSRYGKFYEPDMDYELTALAVESNATLFRGLALLLPKIFITGDIHV